MKPRLVALCALVLAACSLPPAPVPTAAVQPMGATATLLPPDPLTSPTPAPLTESTPPIVIEPAVPVPSPTPALVSAPLPLEKLSILQPGPGSHVTSPFQVIGRGGPSWTQRVRMRLVGEDGRELAQATTYLLAFPGQAGRFIADLTFRIDRVAESGRLEMITDDPRTARQAQLSSVDLVLLSVGSPLIHPGQEGPEKLAILSPREGELVRGGRLLVEGAGWLQSEVPLRVEVLDRQGRTLASADVALVSPGLGQLGTFAVELAYFVAHGQFGRIAVSEPGTTIPGTVHYSSIEVYLEP